MIKPQIPANEEARLKALKEYGVLDTPAEAGYDDLTRIAAMICDTPMATISLIDADRQFLKSKIGPGSIETPREITFCAHTINTKFDLTIITDSRNDDRFKDNPLVLGNPYIIFYAGVPLISPDGYALGTLCVMDQKPRGLTDEQKATLKALANQIINLLELKKKNELLASANRKIDSRARELEDFAYLASHDLKEPLRMIYSYLGLLASKYGAILDEKANTYIQFSIDGAKRMTELIGELLQYAKIDFEETPLKSIDLNVLIEEIISLNLGIIKAKNGHIIYNNLPVINLRETALKIILQNLISNALKYASNSRAPEILITVEEKDDHWLFIVKDNGIGIGHEYFKEIFMPFRRLNNKKEFSGAGLGLSICKKIVLQNGGEIWVDSEKDKGSFFYFTFAKM